MKICNFLLIRLSFLKNISWHSRNFPTFKNAVVFSITFVISEILDNLPDQVDILRRLRKKSIRSRNMFSRKTFVFNKKITKITYIKFADFYQLLFDKLIKMWLSKEENQSNRECKCQEPCYWARCIK